MLKALLKKQFLELTSFIYKKNKPGTKPSPAKLLLYAALFIYAAGTIGLMIYFMMSAICEPLVENGYDWLYFSFAGIFATVVGVFGSVFMTKSQLYDAKDNELLLAMPIKPSVLLFARMVGIYAMTLLFELFILIPTEIVYIGVIGDFSIIAGFIFALLLLPFFTMVFTCLIGWLVAIIAAKMKRKSLATVIFSLAFLFGYFYVYSQMQNYLMLIMANIEEIGSVVKIAGYPLYQFGLAAGGSIRALLIFAFITVLMFGAMYMILSRSFIKIALSSKGTASPVKKTELNVSSAFGASSLDFALLKKEFSRYISSPIYIMNCSLGTLMLIVGAVGLIIKRDMVNDLLVQFGGEFPVALIVGAALCLLSSMNDLTAPSVSLEGKTLWQVKSLPVPAFRLFMAKLNLHLTLTIPPMIICAATMLIIIKPNLIVSLIAIAASIGYTLLCALFGLFVNLKLPTLDWSNEVVPVKQSPSVIIALFANWLILFVAVGIYLLIGDVIGEAGTAAVCTLIYFAASAGILFYLKRKGEKILLSL